MADPRLDEPGYKRPVIERFGGRRRPAVVRPPAGGAVKQFITHLWHELTNDNITDNGAMLAYYAILALFPMLVFVVTLALLVLPEDTVLQGMAMATRAMPSATSELVTAQVTALLRGAHAGFAIGGAALALWGASRGASALMGALNAMFNQRETRPWWKRQVIAISMTLGLALIVILALALLVIGPPAGHWLADRFGLSAAFDLAWDIGRWVGAGYLILVVWALIYKFLPDTEAPLQILTPGAITGVTLWLGISYGFGFYLGKFNNYATTYGALGGAIIFLTWLWLSNIALLFGAEINDVLAHLRAARQGLDQGLSDGPVDGPAESPADGPGNGGGGSSVDRPGRSRGDDARGADDARGLIE
jgi:membrane protein